MCQWLRLLWHILLLHIYLSSPTARFLWRHPCEQMTEKWSGLQMFLPQYISKLGIELYSHKQEYAQSKPKKHWGRKVLSVGRTLSNMYLADQKIVCKAVCRWTSQTGTKYGDICMNFNYVDVHKDICCRQNPQ